MSSWKNTFYLSCIAEEFSDGKKTVSPGLKSKNSSIFAMIGNRKPRRPHYILETIHE
jgi:hypothetical protein